MIANKML